MRKEAQIILVASLALQACAPAISKDGGKGGASEPADKIIIPTLTPIPAMPSPTEWVTPIGTVEIATPTATEKPVLPWIYFSQNKYYKDSTADGCTWSFAGCGIMVGAMVTRTNPTSYEGGFAKYWADKRVNEGVIFNCGGSDFWRHREYLESKGYKFDDLSTGKTVEEVKKQIEDYTSRGIPVWVNTDFYGKGHHSMAIGIDANGNIIFNDPFYGEGVTIPDSKILEVVQSSDGPQIKWKVFAVEPPASH